MVICKKLSYLQSVSQTCVLFTILVASWELKGCRGGMAKWGPGGLGGSGGRTRRDTNTENKNKVTKNSI